MHGEIDFRCSDIVVATSLHMAHTEPRHYAGSCLHVTSIPWLQTLSFESSPESRFVATPAFAFCN